MGLINFLFGSFCLHGDSRLTAVINVLFISDGDIDILSPPPGNNIIYLALLLRFSGDIKRTSH
jgi:hypothetical protein